MNTRPRLDRALDWLAGGGEMGRRLREFDWGTTPLGPPLGWPQSLRTAASMMLSSRYPMFIAWGPQLTFLYNDGYTPIFGRKHPAALGRPFAEIWSEIWGELRPLVQQALGGEPTWSEDLLLFMHRSGYLEETYYTFSYSPIRDETGGVGGMLCVCTETTGRVIGDRRLALLRTIGTGTIDARRWQDAARLSAAALRHNPYDLPFALIYLMDPESRQLRLAGASGIEPGQPGAPLVAYGDGPWQLQGALRDRAAVVVDPIPASLSRTLPSGAWEEPPANVALVPIPARGDTTRSGVLVVGLNPFLAVDADYESFLTLTASQIAASLGNAEAYETERQRAEALTQIDRAKTVFFSNISHEFRTPLTLMLGPVEELLSRGGHEPMAPEVAGQLEIVHRNSVRLLRLVNTLLEFSRIEAGRAQAVYQPTDLAALTCDLAASFSGPIERAGMRFRVDCAPLPEPVYVDRTMWEHIVLNLLSNAFKFTLEGEIRVQVQPIAGGAAARVELRVQDTGTGIAAADLPHLFERFHRIDNARGRTHEGSGIGLALVRDLVALHGGTVTAESQLGEGTTIIVTLPFGSAHLPPDQIRMPEAKAASGVSGNGTAPGRIASPLVAEAMRWLPDDLAATDVQRDAASATADGAAVRRPRIIVADDNADMRRYIAQLLADRFRVDAVADGQAALERARAADPDGAPELILTDVMMPRLGGNGLLRALRADPALRDTPVILLSARVGEEARLEGVQSGADDYLTKPFSARELRARIDAQLRLAGVRRQAAQALRASEDRFREMANTAPAMLWITESQGACTFLSRGWYEFTGQTEAEGLGFGWLAAVHPDDRERTARVFLEANAGQRPFTLDHRVRRADGVYRWAIDAARPRFDDSGAFLGYIGSVIDVHERKLVEDALRESEQRWRQLASSLPQLVWTCTPDGRCDFLSQQWVEYTGLAEAAQLGYGWLEQVHPDDRQRLQIAWEQAIGGGTDFLCEFRIRRHDGVYRHFDTRGIPVAGSDGRVAKWVGSNTDITDRKEAEEVLRDADRRKDEFLATLAHELRNPLAPLANSLHILRQAGDAGGVGRLHEVMERQVAHMTRLVDDLMEVSRVTRGIIGLRKRRVELGGVVRNAIESSRPVIEAAHHQLTVTVPAQPLFLDADPDRLTQIIANLLNNAAKYTDDGGSIELTVRQEGGHAVVAVRDNGMGIPADMLAKVFEMFTQVERTYRRAQGGLGIGLTLVRTLVEMHGGTVGVTSAGPDHGSEFVVRLPMSDDPHGAPSPHAAGARPMPAPAQRVLVVDDNRDAAVSLGLLLQRLGADVLTVHDGPAALAALPRHRPSVLFLDIGMPGMDGYECARRVRAHPDGRAVTIVAVTGWGQDSDRQRSHEAGIDHHMVKPIDTGTVLELLGSSMTD